MTAEQAASFSARLVASGALAEKEKFYRADKAALAVTYGRLADLPIPDRHLAVLRRGARKRAPDWRYAGGLALAASIALAAWFGAPLVMGDPLIGQAMAAYSGRSAPDGRLIITGETSEDQEFRMLAAKIAASIHIPDLTPAGYRLTQIGHYGKGAELRYVSAEGKDFTIFLRPPTGRDRFDMQTRGPLEICVWENQDMAVVMIGAMSTKEMLRLAAATYADLNL